jgi:hypothetical protein
MKSNNNFERMIKMEEKVMNEQEEILVEVVETKKKWLTKKRVLTGLGIVAGVALGALALSRGKKSGEETQSEVVEATYEYVPESENSSEVVE